MSREPYVLEMVQEVPRALAEVFPFFAAPENLEAITPPWLRFRILTPSPIPMREGALIDYRISLRGIPLRWRTRIDAYEPPRMFIDRQIRGPYLLWEHTHLFEEVADGRGVRTRMTDRGVEGALRTAARRRCAGHRRRRGRAEVELSLS